MASRIIAGIDIGSSKITAVIAVVEGEGEPKVIGEASYPSVGVKKGEITGIDDTINSIAQALSAAERMAGLTISSTYVSINGKHVYSNNNKGVVATTSDNEINADDVFRAMDQAKTVAIPQGREIIHLIPREFIVDSTGGIKDPIGMTGSRLEVDAHIISATNTALHNLRKCIQTLGLRIDGEVFTGWASAQAVVTPTEKELGVLLLDIGGGTTSVTTYNEGSVTYSTAVPFGGSNVTRDLAAGLRLSLEDAEKVKTSIDKLAKPVKGKSKVKGSKSGKVEGDTEQEGEAQAADNGDVVDVTELEIEGIKTISRKMFNKIIEARMEETFELVRENISQAGFDYKLPAGVILTGGTAQLPGLTRLAKKVFGVPARIGQPRGLTGLIDGISSPADSTVYGLILEGLSEEDYHSLRSRPISTGGDGGLNVFSKVTSFIKNLLP